MRPALKDFSIVSLDLRGTPAVRRAAYLARALEFAIPP